METEERNYRRNGVSFCVMMTLLLTAYAGVPGIMFQWPIPLLAALLFWQNNKTLNHFAWSVMLVWTPLTILFNLWAITVLHTDAQAGLVYIFYPIGISFVSAICGLVLFGILPLIGRAWRYLHPGERTQRQSNSQKEAANREH